MALNEIPNRLPSPKDTDLSDDTLSDHHDIKNGSLDKKTYISPVLTSFDAICLSQLAHLHRKSSDLRNFLHSSNFPICAEYLKEIYDDFKILVDKVEISGKRVAKVVREGMEAVKMDIEEFLIKLERCLLKDEEWKSVQGFDIPVRNRKGDKSLSEDDGDYHEEEEETME